MSFYDISVRKVNQNKVSLSEYKGKALLIFNSASACGFTPQYEGLQRLYDKYKDKGLEVLDFPCNQFGNQAPGTDSEQAQFCQLNYKTNFETFAKVKVNGKETDPLFKYLKDHTPKPKGIGAVIPKLIKWNFTKFLVDQNGNVINRYEPTTTPEEIEKDIETLLM